MLVKNTLATLLGLAVVADAASVHSYRSPAADGLVRRQAKFNRGGGKNNNQGNNQNNNQGNNQNNNQGNNQNNQGNNNNNNNQASVTCLAPNAIATGSQQTGQNGKAADGQVESAVDPANFINFCAGQTLTNGLQNRDGSCNGVVMGKIPSVNNMVSTIITNPKNFQVLPPNQSFTISLQVNGLNAGSFTNATSTYYSAPQDIGGNGNIIGHTHVTVQDTGNSLDPAQPLDPRQFVFFKGINDAGNGRGGLSTEVTGGLPEGFFRLCTMSSASNHQPVLMPVAQRGTQEDCKYFAVSNNPNILNNAGGGNNNNNNQGNNQNNQGKNNGQGQAQAGQGQNNQGKNNGQGQAQAGQGQNNQGKNNGQGQAQAGQGQAQAGQGQAQAGQGQAQAGQGQAQAGQGQAQAGQGQAQAGQGKNNQQGNQQGQQDSQGKQQGNQQGGQGKANGNQGGNQQANAGGAGAAGALGGIAAPAIQNEGGSRPFVVNGNSFVNREAAVQRSCAIQNNACSNAVNSGSAQGFSVADCNAQEQACRAAA